MGVKMADKATEKHRITMLRELLQLSQTEFSRKIGISQGALSQIESGRSRLSMETLKNLAKAFNVNCNWLVQGEGNIFFKSESNSENSEVEKLIPLIDVRAKAGYIKSHRNFEFLNTLEKYRVPGFEDGESFRMFEVAGESMVPTLFPNEIVIAQKNKNKNINDDAMAVLLTEKELIVKRTKKLPKHNGKIRIISDNPEYPHYEISRSEILELWEVKGKITKKLLQNNLIHSQHLNRIEKEITELKSKIFDITSNKSI